MTWFCNIFKVPALLEDQVKEKACSDSDDAGSSECSDTDSEEQGDQACSRKPAADPEVDKKVSENSDSLVLQCGSKASLISLCSRI